MKLTELSALMREFAESGLTLLEIDGERVRMERTIQAAPAAAPAAPPAIVQQAAPPAAAPAEGNGAVPVRAPLVGIYYAAASPGGEPFVRVGDRVTKGQTLCIVEAMKTMNELASPADGMVTAVLAKDGDVISFDQLLFEVTP
ncbi:MAG: hypothetical protein ABT01_02205 [Clostridium sp. SCN 57-10]|nr:MAG: hypothetical protein ABT01_02205 [Clostridium sp. SCN 57-10]